MPASLHPPPHITPTPSPRDPGLGRGASIPNSTGGRSWAPGESSEITRTPSTPEPAARPLRSPLPAGLTPLSSPPRPAGSVIRLLVPLSGSPGPVMHPRAGTGAPARRWSPPPPPPLAARARGGAPRAGQGRSRLRAASQARTAAGGGPAVSQRGRPGRAAGGGGAEDGLRPGAGRRRRRGRGRGRLRAL